MAENRTNKVFRNEFKKCNPIRYIPNPEDLKKKEEGIVRSEVQLKIRDLIKERYSEEKIKESLNKEEYKSYQTYIDKWIENWLMKLNPNVKIKIIQLLNMGLNKEKILEIMKQENQEIYELYEPTIEQAIETEIQLKKENSKKEEER